MLTECKDHCEHGEWLPWLDAEFGWSDRTAQRFMSAHELMLSKSDKLSDLEIDGSALIALARPST